MTNISMNDTTHNLAEKLKKQIKKTITGQFSDAVDDLVLLTDKKDGVYISKEDPSTLCCLVVGKKSKFLYLVTANMEENQERLSNFGVRIIS